MAPLRPPLHLAAALAVATAAFAPAAVAVGSDADARIRVVTDPRGDADERVGDITSVRFSNGPEQLRAAVTVPHLDADRTGVLLDFSPRFDPRPAYVAARLSGEQGGRVALVKVTRGGAGDLTRVPCPGLRVTGGATTRFRIPQACLGADSGAQRISARTDVGNTSDTTRAVVVGGPRA